MSLLLIFGGASATPTDTGVANAGGTATAAAFASIAQGVANAGGLATASAVIASTAASVANAAGTATGRFFAPGGGALAFVPQLRGRRAVLPL